LNIKVIKPILLIWGRVNKGALGLRRVLGWSYDIS